jgi:preprotein translocase subunit YajC
VFYFFMIRPQMKKAKESKEMRAKLGKGDKIITIGGVHGRITDSDDTTFVIEVESGHRIRIEKTAVSSNPQDQLQAGK